MAKRKQSKGKCSVPSCNRESYTLGLCSPCYSRMRYWDSKSMKQKMKRVQQIHVWESSLEMQMGNIKTLKRKAG